MYKHACYIDSFTVLIIKDDKFQIINFVSIPFTSEVPILAYFSPFAAGINVNGVTL